MKAIVQDRYGSPDDLRLADVETPSIGDDGLLVRVHSASVNALDWHVTRGMPYVVRLSEGRRPRDGQGRHQSCPTSIARVAAPKRSAIPYAP